MLLQKIFPFLRWFNDYDSSKLKADVISGLTVALVLIPQSMAYAQLAGLPVYYGLYASLLPPIVAALFGSSRQLATGPVAVVSLMTAASLEPLATAGSQEYVMYAIILAFTVGLFQLLLGVVRMGLIINLLSHPVVNGFTNAAAIIIATSQLSKMFGVYVDSGAHHYETIYNVIVSAIDYTHVPTLLIGILSIGIMYFLKKYFPKIPYVLVAVVITTLISYFSGFSNNEQVKINQIHSDEVKNNIEEFNLSVIHINQLGKDLTRETKKLDSLESINASKEILLATHYAIDEINLHKAELKEKIHNLRTKLRDYKFITLTDKNSDFILKTNASKEQIDESSIWRIKVGNKQLDTDNILLMGGGAVVGTIPEGLPSFVMPALNFGIFLQMLPFAIIISLLGFMEAIAIAKAIASKTGQKIDPNQELIGQGLGNILGSFTSSYPVSGSFSRSAVNLQAGGETGLSSAVTSIMVGITLLFFTPLLYHLPQSVLASIIMMAVVSLIGPKGFVHAWRAKWYDGVISLITFVVTLAYAPHLENGIYLGVVLSLLVYLYKSMRPKVTQLSRFEDQSLRDKDFHELDECEYITLIRFEGPLIFANASYLEEEINKRMRQKKKLRHIIIVCNAIYDMDATGEEAMALLVDRVRSGGYRICFSGLNETLVSILKRTYLYEKIGTENIFSTMESAILHVIAEDHDEHIEEECPLLTMYHMMELRKKKKGIGV